jgi:hypothetical protein
VSRSLFDVGDDQVISALHAFMVHPAAGANQGFGIADELLAMHLPGVAIPGEGYCEAIVIVDINNNIFAAVSRGGIAGRPGELRRWIGKSVESSFHDTPGVPGWRDMQDGSRAYVWLRTDVWMSGKRVNSDPRYEPRQE